MVSSELMVELDRVRASTVEVEVHNAPGGRPHRGVGYRRRQPRCHHHHRLRLGPGDIVRCAACGHMQVDELRAEEALGEDYSQVSEGAYLDEEAGQRATAARALERIEGTSRWGGSRTWAAGWASCCQRPEARG